MTVDRTRPAGALRRPPTAEAEAETEAGARAGAGRPAVGLPRAADRWPPLLGAAGLALVAAWAGGSAYHQDLAVLFAVYALIGLGMYVPFVMAGSLSMAYGAYAGIGAYAVLVAQVKLDAPFWLGWPAGCAVAVAVAVLLGLATARLSGFFLAAVTLLFGTAFQRWLVASEDLTGGASGMAAGAGPAVLGWHPGRGVLMAAGLLLVWAVAWLVDRLRRGAWGVTVRAAREVPLAVESCGVRTRALDLLALATGAAIASMGGALFATFQAGVTPETFTLDIVFLAVFMPLIGGLGTSWGAVVGALVVVETTVNLPVLDDSGKLVLTAVVLAVLLVAPNGLLGYLDRTRRRFAPGAVRGGRDGARG
ncbi:MULTISPECIES: branched-chain amino acid ABC transporter permease [Actinomadura]|uniref:Branched-chain amino acid ABC transporter permease n=1 Tax=Actinomadura yumaensis TaxID=111807 RepID=A0ABW2CCE9_9ACTN|nr:branched-chain amino acid ABC transporter permease [Actinomadura sp. J1-007]MWK38244.1 branched-chain amino acid ABC transporter permease [Actinomadura sp. J1-007]